MEKVACRICGHQALVLTQHLLEAHRGMTVAEYQRRFPGAPWAAEDVLSMRPTGTRKEGSQTLDGKIRIGGIALKVYDPPTRGASKPKCFEYPEEEAKVAALFLSRCQRGFPRNIYVWGPAGTGKSVLGKALAHDLNYEFSFYNLRDGVDPETMLGYVEAENGETVHKLGSFAKDLQGRDDGKGGKRPVFIMLDDVDRATPAIAEVLRSVLDSETRSVFIPECQCWVDVHPETVIWGTGNSNGQGDQTGMFASVEVQDASLLDRYHRVLKVGYMEPEFEKRVLQAKFPQVASLFIDRLVRLANEIRSAIQRQELFINFGHRPLENATEMFEDLFLAEQNSVGSPSRNLAKEAVKNTILGWLSGDNLTVVSRLVDSHFPD